MQKEKSITNRVEFDFHNNIFRKYLSKEKFISELEMSQLASDISSTSNLFDTPNLIRSDHDNSILEFELIDNAITLREFFIALAGWGATPKQQSELCNIFYRLGQSIFIIHNRDINSINVSIRKFPSALFSQELIDQSVLIHGDFTLSNILFTRKSERIDIIDWSTSPIFHYSANVGPRYWDLSFFISSLFYLSYSTFFSYQLRGKLVKEFLSGYLHDADLNSAVFLSELSGFLRRYNYYKLYYSDNKMKINRSNQFLIKRTKSKLDAFISLLPTLLND